MANPQLEDGRTEIANELVEALSETYFSPAESKILWTVIRKTYGWHKKSDRISYSQFEESTKMNRRHIGPALKRLIDRNIITSSNSGEKHVSEYGLQKDHEIWEKSVTETGNKKNKSVTDLGNKSVTETGNNLTPKQVTDENFNLLPISVPSVTDSCKNLLPKQVTTKAIQKQLTKENIYSIPSWIKKEIWDAFLEMRKKIKKPLTDYGSNLVIKKLEKFKLTGDDPNEILNQSILHSWQGVWPLKNKYSQDDDDDDPTWRV